MRSFKYMEKSSSEILNAHYGLYFTEMGLGERTHLTKESVCRLHTAYKEMKDEADDFKFLGALKRKKLFIAHSGSYGTLAPLKILKRVRTIIKPIDALFWKNYQRSKALSNDIYEFAFHMLFQRFPQGRIRKEMRVLIATDLLMSLLQAEDAFIQHHSQYRLRIPGTRHMFANFWKNRWLTLSPLFNRIFMELCHGLFAQLPKHRLDARGYFMPNPKKLCQTSQNITSVKRLNAELTERDVAFKDSVVRPIIRIMRKHIGKSLKTLVFRNWNHCVKKWIDIRTRKEKRATRKIRALLAAVRFRAWMNVTFKEKLRYKDMEMTAMRELSNNMERKKQWVEEELGKQITITNNVEKDSNSRLKKQEILLRIENITNRASEISQLIDKRIEQGIPDISRLFTRNDLKEKENRWIALK